MSHPNPPADHPPVDLELSPRANRLTGALFVAALSMLLAAALLAFSEADTAAVVTMIIGAVLLIGLFPYDLHRQHVWKKRWEGAFSPFGHSGVKLSSQTHIKM